MRGSSFRFARFVLVALAVWAGYAALAPYQLGWLVLPTSLVLLTGYALWRWLQARRVRQALAAEERWSQALIDESGRRAAIAELRAARASEEDEETHLRYTLLLADLLAVDGLSAEARELLGALRVDGLDPVEGAMVRHARASLSIRMGEPQAAAALLHPRAPRCGSVGLDRRLELLDALVACEEGRAAEALDIAVGVQRAAGQDEGLALEARIVRVAALDASGDNDEAAAALAALGPEVLPAIAALGSPRLRSLAAEAKKGT